MATKRSSKKTGSKLGVVNVKTATPTRKRLQANARKYAKGNLSAWMRIAGLRYVPKRGEKIPLTTV